MTPRSQHPDSDCPSSGSAAGSNSDRSLASACGPCSTLVTNDQPAELFKALADPNRVALLARLADCGRACTVSEIACCLPIDLSVVSRHLRQLREAGILYAERRGKEVRYKVRYGELARTLRALADAIEACCPDH